MRVEWEEMAEWNRDQIGDYIFERFGYNSLEHFYEEVNQTVNMIMRHPNLGSLEPLLADLPQGYRSVVVEKLSKLAYRIEGDTIYIVDFWDCRREPQALSGEVSPIVSPK